MTYDNKLAADRNKIIELLEDRFYRPLRVQELVEAMEVSPEERADFNAVLGGLIKDGLIIETKKGKLMSAKRLNIYRGVFSGNARGFGFVSIDGIDGDVFIPAPATNGAMHKDFVLVKIIEGPGYEKSREGEIISILERGMNKLVGTFCEGARGAGFVVPDEKKISGDIYIPRGSSKNAANGHKVVLKVIKNAEAGRSAEGVVTDIIGHENDPGVDILSIVLQSGIPVEFSAKLMRETERIPVEVSDSELQGREDFRNGLIITIDGEDAKDLDDAVSLVTLPNGNYELSVHIADVCNYVKEGTEIGAEAYKRGTSVYLADRVIPMLPHKLSNGICSLNPRVDRLTLSCVMELDGAGKVVSHRITEGVIKTACRMTYDEVDGIISGETPEIIGKYADIVPMILKMNELREILWQKRLKRGSIEFGTKESRIIVDENGRAIDIQIRERTQATNLIEEFMIVCNETVAEDYFWAELPFVYRTHEEPSEEKLERLSDTVRRFGYRIKGKKLHSKALQELLLSLAGKPEEGVISRLALRSLKQARYTPECEGHFGLASRYYCHFTSPIRRYPDLQIHRIIKKNIHGELLPEEIERLNAMLSEVCGDCSSTERRAEEAEREVENLKKVEFMEDKVGEKFTGIISGVTGWGFYVELANGVEGLVSASELDDDLYIFVEDEMRYTGKHTKKSYCLGDPVEIIVAKADKENRRLDFSLTDDED